MIGLPVGHAEGSVVGEYTGAAVGVRAPISIVRKLAFSELISALSETR